MAPTEPCQNEEHQSDEVDANRLGTLLNETGVPLMVLNACQSGMQKEANPYASVAARLIRAGVGNVLAMNYSVLVVAAHKFVAAFYAALANGRSIGQAVDSGRRELMADKERHSLVRPNAAGDLIEERLTLKDWFLPALYQQSADPTIFPTNHQPPATSDHPPLPTRQTYPGLVGLLAQRFNLDELHLLAYQLGLDYEELAGEVKTRKILSLVDLMERQNRLPDLIALARNLRPDEQWDTALTPAAAAHSLAPALPNRQSSIVNRQFPASLPAPPRYGFWGRSRELLGLERAFRRSPAVVLHGFGGLGKTTLATEAGRWLTRTGRFPGGAAFISFEGGGSLEQLCSWVGQTLSGDPDWVIHGAGPLPERLAALLAEKPALLILDNFESVLGRDPLMPPEELQEILDFVGQVFNLSGQSERLPYSRLLITTRDTTFNDARFAPSRLCRHIPLGGLADHDALALAAAVLDAANIDRATIPRQALLDLMAHLGGHPLSLNLVLPHLATYTPAELTARFEELLPGFVAGKAQARNESLAVSLEFSLRRLGEETRAALPDLAVFTGVTMEVNVLQITEMDAALWRTARGELEQAALLTVETVPGVNPPFLQFHPTLLPYLATRLNDERRAELEARYWQFYFELATMLYQADTQTPHQARAIAAREMGNLRRALGLALAAGALAEAAGFATRIARFLDVFGRWRERDAVMEEVNRQLSMVNGQWSMVNEGRLTKAEFLILMRQGETLLQQGRAKDSEQVWREILRRIDEGAAYDAAHDRALAYRSIGLAVAAQGRPSQAIPYHQQALAGFAALSENNKSAKEMLGKVYADVADNLAATGQFAAAQEAYETSLKICQEVEDHRAVGVALGQLGTLALRRGDRETARERYTAALETFRRLGEPQAEAAIWHQLGMVAQQERQWAEAERCYREAVAIRERIRDWPLLATTFNQLARVAEGDGRFPDAERWYLRAQEIKDQIAPNDASTLGNLANLYLSQNRLTEAENYARRALVIMETLDLSAEPWKTYAILAEIAVAQGQTAVARDWRRKEQESYAAYAGSLHEIREWLPIIEAVVAVCQGNTAIKPQVEGILTQYEQGWSTSVAAVRQIIAGERDIEILREELTRKGFVLVYTILQQLSGEAPPAAQTPTARQTPGVGEPGSRETPGVSSDPLAQLRQAWGPVVVALVAAAQGDGAAATQVEPILQELAGKPEWAALAGALRRILAGGRDPAALLPGLDDTDTLIAASVLRGLGVVHVELAGLPDLVGGQGSGGDEEQGSGGDGEQGGEGVSLNEFLNGLLNGVVAAGRPDAPPGLAAQLHAVTAALAGAVRQVLAQV